MDRLVAAHVFTLNGGESENKKFTLIFAITVNIALDHLKRMDVTLAIAIVQYE